MKKYHLFKSFKSYCFIWLLLLSHNIYAAQTIPVWTYYPSPPFITGHNTGLSYDLVRLLNSYENGKYQFELKYLPRPRINRNLQEEIEGLVIFVNWAWMGDPDQNKYIWSLPLLHDQNDIISRKSGKKPNQINYHGTESLFGTIFGGISGRRYKGLEAAFDSGKVKRQDVREEEQNLNLLIHGRIDVTSIASTVNRYKIKEKGIQDEIYFSPNPLYVYTRHFLIVNKLKHLENYINQFIQSLEGNKKWQAIKEKYSVH